MDKKLNPELVKAGACMAIPFDDPDEWNIDLNGLVFRVTFTPPYHVLFDPLQSYADAWRLERALKASGWEFGKDEDGFYARGIKYLQDHSDTLLLYKCLSSVTNIPMWLE